MAMSVEQYQAALLALLPKGDAWPTDLDSDMAKLMHGIAEEFARIDARAEDQLRESHPSSAAEMFEEWEHQYALPLPCITDEQTMVERRAALVQAYQAHGGQSRAFFIAVAAALGFTITIDEFIPMHAGCLAGAPCNGEDWAFVFQVNAPETTTTHFTAGTSVAGEALASWGNAMLECAIKRLVHAHRVVQFSYS